MLETRLHFNPFRSQPPRSNHGTSSAILSCFAELWIVALITPLMVSTLAYGSTDYYRHVDFDNSLNSDYYFYSWASHQNRAVCNRKTRGFRSKARPFLHLPMQFASTGNRNPGEAGKRKCV